MGYHDSEGSATTPTLGARSRVGNCMLRTFLAVDVSTFFQDRRAFILGKNDVLIHFLGFQVVVFNMCSAPVFSNTKITSLKKKHHKSIRWRPSVSLGHRDAQSFEQSQGHGLMLALVRGKCCAQRPTGGFLPQRPRELIPSSVGSVGE